jgi:hypothetical protein
LPEVGQLAAADGYQLCCELEIYAETIAGAQSMCTYANNSYPKGGTNMDATSWLLRKISEFKDIFVIGGIGFFGFGVGEISVSFLWCIAWVFNGFDSKATGKSMSGYHPGDLMGQWWKATKHAWHEFWGTKPSE